jgi:membrane-bound lytic murein transglycosylase D
MMLCFRRFSQLVLGLIFVSCVTPTFGQDDTQLPDVEKDSLPPTLVAKGVTYVAKPVSYKELSERLSQLSGCLELKNTSTVKSYVMHYLYRPEKTKRILSRRVMYFPVFEQVLREEGLPDDLKYLAVVESALNAKAISSAGAGGLWQFMPSTGIEYGLQINSAIDERSNVIKSTQSAAKYLKHLFNQYNDWALALAAYNSGPHRVDAAIRRTRSRNFWVIQKYLPSETRNYVPAFIAATYICNFFNEHNLEPDYPELDMQLTDYVRVHEGMSMSAIANATGLKYQAVIDLNPGFKRAYVPPSQRGYYVILPQRVMPAFINHLNGMGGRKYDLDMNRYTNDLSSYGDGRYYHVVVSPAQAELVDQFASKMGCNGAQIAAWNNLPNNIVYPNQPLKIWRPVLVQRSSNERIAAPGSAKKDKPTPANGSAAPKPNSNTVVVGQPSGNKPAANPSARPVAAAPASTAPNDVTSPSGAAKPAANAPTTIIRKAGSGGPQKQYQFHKVKEGENLASLARRYNVSLDQLQVLNETTEVKPGALVKIKELK